MNYVEAALLLMISTLHMTNGQECDVDGCPANDTTLVCGFEIENMKYKMFPSKCVMIAYIQCYEALYIQTPIEFCVKYHNKKLSARRDEDESCPVFCASYWRPVCAAHSYRSYVYRTFLNQCYLDMLNCRGDDDIDSYVEVPLEHCQNHANKNFYQEHISAQGLRGIKHYD